MRRWSFAIIAGVVAFFRSTALSGVALAAPSYPILPLRTVIVEVPEVSRPEFFQRLQEFSDSYAFSIRIAPNRPDIPSFLIYLERADTTVIGTNFDVIDYAIVLDTFELSFYPNGDDPVGVEAVDEMVGGLTRLLGTGGGWTVLAVE